MAITKTLVPDSSDVWGKTRVEAYDITLDTSYPTGGYSLPASALGWSQINGAVKLGGNSTAGGYEVHYDTVNAKLMVFRSAGFTPAGTNGTSAVSGNVTVVGGAIGEAIGINPDSNAGVLSKAAATNRTIPIATFLGAAPTAAAQTFTGTAVAAGALAQVSNGVNLSTVTVRVRFEGI